VAHLGDELAEAGVARVLDHMGEQRCTEPAPLDVGTHDQRDFSYARRDPGDGAECQNLAAEVERADRFDAAVVEPEQSSECLGIAERRRPSETSAYVVRLQQPPELDASCHVVGTDTPDAHGAEAAECAGARAGVGDRVQIAAMEPDILESASVERVQLPQRCGVAPRARELARDSVPPIAD
jgi:hypothetical protein